MLEREGARDARGRIALVIPVRNEEHTLEALLSSALAQTRKPDEIVVVDAGSTDRSAEVARTFAAVNAAVRVIEIGAAYPGEARNAGVRNTAAEWIAFTDPGLQLAPDWLQHLTKVVTAGVHVV